MPTIDERVVEMRFDNGQFERNVDQSMSTLDKLKAALNFDKSADGLKNLQNAGRGFNLNPVATAVETVTGKLSAMEIIGISALNRLTNQGMAMMERFVKSVSTDQITAGFTKYGQKTSAVQTIMAATAKDFEGIGGQMEYVNEQLTKLNWFTDETSYSFLDMVNNIGKFTSNGIKLDSAVTSMQGISTWAALSGANVQEASRAMYNLAQAISVGSVKLIDWKSIENANMATAEFKETVIQTALEMGTLEKKGDKIFVKGSKKAEVSVKNFNSELSKGWFSSEVLQKSLARYGEFTNKLYEFADATGETATELIGMIDEYIEADNKTQFITEHAEELDMSVEELTTHLNTLSSSEMELGRKAFKAAQEAKTFQEAVDSVKDAVSTGWMQSFEYMFGNYEEAKKIWTALANEMWDVFAGGGERRNNILEMWHNGWQELDKDGNIIMKMAGGYDVLYEAIGNLWQGVKNLMSPMQDAWDIIFGVSEKERARQLIVLTNRFKDFSLKVKGFITQVEKPFEKFGKAVDTVAKDAKSAFDGATKPLDKVKKEVEKVGELISTVERTERDLGRLTKEVLADKYGTGDKRKKALRELGYSYEVVQNEINRLNNCSKRHKILQKDLEKVHQDTTKAVKEESEATEELANDMSASERRYFNLLRIFRGLFAAVDVVKKGFTEAGKAVAKIFTHALEKAMPVFDGILGALGDFGDKVFEFRENLGKNNVIADFFNKVADAVNNFVDKFSDFISRVWNKIANSEALPRLIGALKSLKDTIVELVSAGLSKLMEMFNNVDTDKVSDIFDSIFGSIANTSSDVLEFIVNHKEDIKKFFGIFTDTVAKTIGGIGQALSDLWKGFDGYKNSSAKEVGGFFENLFASFNAMFKDENSTFNKVKKSIDGFTASISQLLQNMTPENAKETLKNGAFALLAVSISSTLLSLSSTLKSLKEVPETLVKMMKGLFGAISAYQDGIRADAILKVAKAIGILTLSLIALSFIPKEQLTDATSTLISLMMTFALVMKAYSTILSLKFNKYNATKPLNNFLNSIKDIAARAARIASIGAVLIGIGTVVAAFVYLVKVANEIKADVFERAIGYFEQLMTIVGVLMVTLMGLDKLLGGTNLTGVGTAFFGLGVGMLAIAAAAKILSTIDLKDLGPIIGNIMGLMLAMGAATLIGNGRTMIRMAAGLVIFAGALALLVPVLMALCAIPEAMLRPVLIDIGLMVGTLVLLSAVMSLVDAKTGTSIVQNIIALAGALALLTIPIIVLGSNENAANGIGLLSGLLLILTIFAGLAMFMAAGFKALSESLVTIGMGALLFGAGCALIAASIWIVAKALPELVDGFVKMGEQIQKNGDKIAIAFGVLFLAIAAGIVIAKSGIISSAIDLIGGILEAAKNSTPKFLFTVASIILTILGFVSSFAPKLVDALFNILVSVLIGIGDAIRNKATLIVQALGLILNAIFALLLTALDSLLRSFGSLGGWVADKLHLRDMADDLKETGNELSSEIKEQLKSSADELKELDGYTADAIGTGNEAEEAAEKKAESVVNSYQKGLSIEFDPKEVKLEDKTEGLIETAAEKSKPKARRYAHQVSEELIAAGVEGIVEGEDDLYNASTNTLGIVSKKAAAQAAGMASLVGEQWDQGVAGGIRSKAYVVNAAARIVASGISSVANKELQIKSPSRVGERIGKFFDMGVGVGLTKNIDLATDPAEVGANTIVAKMRAALDTIGSSVMDDLRPTISPVLDLSDIQNGANLVNGMFSGTTAQLAFAASGSFVPQKESMMDAFRMALSGSMEDISAKLDDINVNGVYKFETPVILNGREIARGTAEYTREELNKLDRINSRKGGRL